MTNQLSIAGVLYEDSEPLYLSTMDGTLLFNRVTGKWVTWSSLSERATREGWEWSNREIGIPSIQWRINHRTGGYEWGPGLDDTSGLASETVTNGDEFTGASGATPPTGWSATGDPTFQLFPSVVNISGGAVVGGGMEQAQTLTPGAWYVCEVLVAPDTTPDAKVGIDGLYVPLFGQGDPDAGTHVVAFSFQAPASGSATISFLVLEGGLASIDHVRCYLESELTGASATSGGTSVPDPVQGPYMADGVDFWIDTGKCKVGFDIDSDPSADVWVTRNKVCKMEISEQLKMAIDAQLTALGCAGLPCMES